MTAAKGIESKEILIVGGYGQVGTTIARKLAPSFPQGIVVCRRDDWVWVLDPR